MATRKPKRPQNIFDQAALAMQGRSVEWLSRKALLYDPVDQPAAIDALAIHPAPKALRGLAIAATGSFGLLEEHARDALKRHLTPLKIKHLSRLATRDKNSSIRSFALSVLCKTTHPLALTTLLKVAHDKDTALREYALDTLADRAEPRALNAFIQGTQAKSRSIQKSSILGLAALGTLETLAPLAQILFHAPRSAKSIETNEHYKGMRSAALDALCNLPGEGKIAPLVAYVEKTEGNDVEVWPIIDALSTHDSIAAFQGLARISALTTESDSNHRTPAAILLKSHNPDSLPFAIHALATVNADRFDDEAFEVPMSALQKTLKRFAQNPATRDHPVFKRVASIVALAKHDAKGKLVEDPRVIHHVVSRVLALPDRPAARNANALKLFYAQARDQLVKEQLKVA